MSTVAATRRASLPSGLLGMALAIATETAFFGCLLAAYFYLRLRAVTWPPHGVPEPHVLVPVVLTGVLVSTTVPLLLASRTAARGFVGRTRLLLAAALLVQCGYLAYQAFVFRGDVDAVLPTRTAYGSAYTTILGGHHVHVLVGILLDLWLLARLASGLTPRRATAVRVVAWYWCFVNALAIVVTLTLVSPAL